MILAKCGSICDYICHSTVVIYESWVGERLKIHGLGAVSRLTQIQDMNAESNAATKRIYLSGTYVIEGVQSHYGVAGGSQSASVTIRITSDRFEGGISTVKIRFDNQCFKQNNDLLQEAVRVPEIKAESDRKVLIIFQPMASLSAWLNMLTQAPQQSYYIDYGFEEHRAWAFAAPVGNREHPIGKCLNG